MTNNPRIQQIVDAIRSRQHFVLSSHSRPDGDSIGSQLAMAYALKIDGPTGQTVTPLTGLIDPQLLLHGEGNTIMYEQHPKLRELMFGLFSTGASPTSSAMSLRQLLCCLPQIPVPGHITYDNIFRVIIMQFLDAHNFDVRSVKKTCVHIVHPDGRIIPFDTFNLFYRDEKEHKLQALRRETTARSLPILGTT